MIGYCSELHIQLPYSIVRCVHSTLFNVKTCIIKDNTIPSIQQCKYFNISKEKYDKQYYKLNVIPKLKKQAYLGFNIK
jgi:hypothetical protein